MAEQPKALPFGPYRKYPTYGARQDGFSDAREVCAHCLSGACCSSEGPIALTSFDVLRLSAFFDMSPAQFLLAFTQDRFAGETSDEPRRLWIESPDSSVVTFLRRRTKYPASPCIFLKYVHGVDGTPRRVCSVHPARPLACREYYYDTCKKRVTGELAVVQSEGLEMIRDGKITPEVVDASCKSLEPVSTDDSLAKKWQYAFWTEMRRALNIEETNNEGADSYPISDYQDVLDEKLNRLLSARFLRFEEKYGSVPHSEQIQPYAAGLSFKGSPDHERILRIIRTPPTRGLFDDQDYPYYAGVRTLMPGVRLADDFGQARGRVDTGHANIVRAGPAGSNTARANKVRSKVTHSDRDAPYADAIVRGWNFLLGLAAHAAHAEPFTEVEPWGTFELALLEALLPFGQGVQRQLTGTTCLDSAQRWAAAVVSRLLEQTYLSLVARDARPKAWTRFYATVGRLVSHPAPRGLARMLRILRADAARRKRVLWHPDRLDRWLQLLTRSRTVESWSMFADRLRVLRACEALGVLGQSASTYDAVLETVERARAGDSQPARVFDALNILTRARRLPAPARRRLADFACRWATRVEGSGPWESGTLLRWAALCARLGIAGTETPGFTRSLNHALATQSADGSWGTDVRWDAQPAWQSDYLLGAIRSTAAAVESLCAALSPGARGRPVGLGGNRGMGSLGENLPATTE